MQKGVVVPTGEYQFGRGGFDEGFPDEDFLLSSACLGKGLICEMSHTEIARELRVVKRRGIS